METAVFPKMKQQFDLPDLLSLEDHLHSQRSFEDPLMIPTYYSTWDNTDSKLNYLSTNHLLQNPTTICSSHESQLNIDNKGADFHLWNECPPLSEDAWKPISQLPPSSLPYTIGITSNQPIISSFDSNNDDHQLLLTNNTIINFNDESLGAVVAEGFAMPRQGVKMEENSVVDNGDNNVMINEHDEEIIRGIKGNSNNNNNYKKIEWINYEQITKYFEMPISKAAKELNVGLTVLKKRCRELNIKRWPHRKIKSLEALICNVKELGMMDMVEDLEAHKRRLQKMPGLELTEETKRLRQACFKANYRKRRALALA